MGMASLAIGLIIIFGSSLSYFGLPIPFFAMPSTLFASFPLGVVGLVLGILAVKRKSIFWGGVVGIVLNSLVILFPVAIIVAWAVQGD